MPEAEPLEKMLGQIMEPDPRKRGDSPSDVRDPLIRALPDPPSFSTPVVVPELESEVDSFDLNKTDSLFAAPSPTVAHPTGPHSATEMTGEATVFAEIAAVEDGDGWPEVLFDDPELPPSLDETEDTDVRNPVPVDVWVPQADGIGGVESTPAAVNPDARSASSRRVSRLEIAVVAAVVIVLGSIIAFTWSTVDVDDGLAVATAIQLEERASTEALVPPPPDDNLFDDLLAVQQLVDAGDLEAAWEAVNVLESRDGFSFSSDESALYDSLVAAVARASDRGAALEALRTGLNYGSIKMVRRGVAGLTGFSADEIADIDGLVEDLAQARKALRLHADMWDAHREGDYLGAIENSWRLEGILPGYSGAVDVREQSAAVLEARSEAFIAGSKYTNAIAVLESMQRVWPDRDGSAARIAWCRKQVDLTRRGESLIAGALAKGEAGDPEGGLAVLDGMTPTPDLQGEVDRARFVLENRLSEMDSNEPVIVLATAMELGFKKNETITIPLKVSDDYRVERVVVHARNEADDGYLQILLQPDDEGLYNFSIAPELHGNKHVYFFVVARDRSGHVGRLGSQDEPQRVTRKKWFKKLL